MTWVKMPIQEQWEDSSGNPASGYVIKAYLPGTTTVTPMAIDKNGTTTVTSVTLNANGVPAVSGNQVVLYIDREFKYGVFADSTAAAANSSPTYGFYDNVKIDAFISGNYLTIVDDYTELLALDPDDFTAGDIVTVTDDGISGQFVVTTGSATDDGGIVKTNATWNTASKHFERLSKVPVNVKWFGAVGDGVTDDYAEIVLAIKYCIALKAANSSQGVSLIFPDGVYVTTQPIPIVSGIIFKGCSRFSTRILCTGTGAAIYSATYSAGAFTDTLDATLSDVMNKVKYVNSAGLIDLAVDHTGTISGNSGSGVAWSAVIQLVGCPNFQMMNVQPNSTQDNINGASIKYSWRSQIDGFQCSRNGSNTGGIALLLDSQTNAALVSRPFIYGSWDVGISFNGVESSTLIEPNIEFSTIGARLIGRANKILGGYFEGNGTDIKIGNGTSTGDRYLIENTWHNGSSSDYGIDLESGIRGTIRGQSWTGTYSSSLFKTAASATYCYGNEIEIMAADATTVSLATLGLSGGRNIVRVIGEDYDIDDNASRGYAEYASRTGGSANIGITGTFSPTFTCGTSGSVTLDTSEDLLSYIKIGGLVFISGQVSISSVSSPTGTMTIGNLPYVIATTSERSETAVFNLMLSATTTNTPTFIGVANTAGASSFSVRSKDNTGAFSSSTAGLFSAGDVFISGFYRTNT
jgi:hypothetical protein